MAKLFMALIVLPIMKVASMAIFLRYGIGGELQIHYAALPQTHYLPITDDKHRNRCIFAKGI